MTFSTILAVGLGGFIGAITRAYVVHIANKHFVSEFPFGILTVNIVGSFLIGIMFALLTTYAISAATKSFIITGFLGALTTYSTFAMETFILLESSFFYGIMNIILNLCGTILAAGSGYKIITHFIK